MVSALLSSIGRKQIVLADTYQRFVGARGADYRACLTGTDHATFKPPLREIVEADVPEGNIEMTSQGSNLRRAIPKGLCQTIRPRRSHNADITRTSCQHCEILSDRISTYRSQVPSCLHAQLLTHACQDTTCPTAQLSFRAV